MSHLSRADADKLLELILTSRAALHTAVDKGWLVTVPDEERKAAWAADDTAYKAVRDFVRSLEVDQ